MASNTNSEMDHDTHAFNVGVLWSMLLSLELMMRFCIREKTGEKIPIPNLETLTEGMTLERSAIIDCNTLTNVIQKFNKEFKDLSVSVDEDKLVCLRNAIGHGKILSQEPPFPNPMTIFNLEGIKGNPDHVRVSFKEEMSGEWFMSNRKFLKKEGLKLKALHESLRKEKA